MAMGQLGGAVEVGGGGWLRGKRFKASMALIRGRGKGSWGGREGGVEVRGAGWAESAEWAEGAE